ncbi:putative secreted protein [Ixodes scapularis]
MKVSSCLFAGICALLVGGAPAFASSCVNISLFDVNGIGKCLGSAGDFCTGGNTAAVTGVQKILQCTLQSISSLSLGSQLSLIQPLATFLLNRAGFGSLANLLFQGCTALNNTVGGTGGSAGGSVGGTPFNISASLANLLKCTPISLGSDTLCNGQITISLPSVLNIANCASTVATACTPGSPATPSMVQSDLAAVTCLVQGITDSSISGLGNQLTCTLINYLLTTLGRMGPMFVPLVSFIKMLLDQCVRKDH